MFTQSENRPMKSGQTSDVTPAGSTSKDSGGNAIAGIGDSRSFVKLTTGQYSGTTTVTVNAKNDAHTNAVVQDRMTGLMWQSEETPAIYGAGADHLHWDDQVDFEHIFEYCAQANLAELSGYSDWRVPNQIELLSITSGYPNSGHPDSTYWPTISGELYLWTGDTVNNAIANAKFFFFAEGQCNGAPKTTTTTVTCLLVRG